MYFGVEELICKEIKLLRLWRVFFNVMLIVFIKMVYLIMWVSYILFLFLKLLENNWIVDDEVGII